MAKRNSRNKLFFLRNWNGGAYESCRRYECSNLNNMHPDLWSNAESDAPVYLQGFYKPSDYDLGDITPPSGFLEFYIEKGEASEMHNLVSAYTSIKKFGGWSYIISDADYINLRFQSILIDESDMTY